MVQAGACQPLDGRDPLTRLNFHHAFVVPELAEVFLDLIIEGVRIATAAGVGVDDWPAILPVKTLTALPRDQALRRIAEHGQHIIDVGMTDIRISMLQSIERGRRTEVEAIQGHLLRRGDRLGVDAPATRLAYRLIAGLDRLAQ